MGFLADIAAAFVDHPEHWGPSILSAAPLKWWLPLFLPPLLLIGFHTFQRLTPRLRRVYVFFLGLTITLFSGLFLVRAASNVVTPPEWDMLAFWTFGKVAATGQDFYSSPAFHAVARA